MPEGNPANIDLSVNAINYTYKACGRAAIRDQLRAGQRRAPQEEVIEKPALLRL